MINMSLYNAVDEQAKNDAKKYVEQFIRSLNAFFEGDFDLKTYANNLYELLNYEGFDDYKIRSSKCDRKLYEYISRGELKPKFSKAYLNAFSYVNERVSKIYDIEIANARKNEETGSPFYKFYIDPNGKRIMTTEIISKAMFSNVSDEELDNFIVDYINNERIKSFSVAKKQEMISDIEVVLTHKPIPADDIKKFAIALAILFGICWISKLSYEAKNNQEQEKTNKPKYSYQASHTSSSSDHYALYDLEKNEYVIGDDSVAKL